MTRVGPRWIWGVLLAGALLGGSAQAEPELRLVRSRACYQSGDELWIRLELRNPGPALQTDLYAAILYQGIPYFYPSWGTEPESSSLTLGTDGQASLTLVPPVVLPEELPKVVAELWAVTTREGTYEIVGAPVMVPLLLQDRWPILPRPDPWNSLVVTISDGPVTSTSSQETWDDLAEELRVRFPQAGPYLRLGTSVYASGLDPTQPPEAAEALQRAREAGLCLGIHTRTTNHHAEGAFQELRQADRRNCQWDIEGQTALPGTTGPDATLTPSRLALEVVSLRRELQLALGEACALADSQQPGILAWVSGPVEVELWQPENEVHYADYSPFAVAEFRDWLRHTGIYHDQTGAFAGQGAPGWLIDHNDFSEDPTPNIHLGPGPSFNQYFGTEFLTWSLKFWDPVLHPEPLSHQADPLPAPGRPGGTAHGFDPPRMVDGEVVTPWGDRFLALWDGYGGTTFGFRQCMIWNYVQDSTRWIAEAGFDPDRSYSHQIPSGHVDSWVRDFCSASPFWTGYSPDARLGLTAFFDTTRSDELYGLCDQYFPGFGIFEYHPDPFLEEDRSHFDQALELAYQHRVSALNMLNLYSNNLGRWGLADTVFEAALRDFMQARVPGTDHRRFDQPYLEQGWVDHRPPRVREVHRQGDRVEWSRQVWPDQPELSWTNWGEHAWFEVHQGPQPGFIPNEDTLVGATSSFYLNDLPTGGTIRVLAISRLGLTSPIE